jgi:type II secretory pathway component PulJ
MLLSAGYSLGAALSRLARRSEGAVSRDLRRVVSRVRHGLDENTALREWATTADVPAVGRLVGVLALNREAGDLGHLITNEARAVRSEVHRELVEVIERRGQQVWIPVTVATLLPGLLFLAVPFTEAHPTEGATMHQPTEKTDTTTAAAPRPASESASTGTSRRRRLRLRSDRGEGVISAAIAVLIMAFLGAAMWIGFQQMWKSTEATTNDKITQIGSE